MYGSSAARAADAVLVGDRLENGVRLVARNVGDGQHVGVALARDLNALARHLPAADADLDAGAVLDLAESSTDLPVILDVLPQPLICGTQLLTPREIEMAKMVTRGLRNKAIAELLFVSESTVKTHLHSIFEKLGVRSRAELIAYCNATGIA